MTRIYPDELTPELITVLKLMNFQTGPIAHRLRAVGHTIEPRCEEEQAYVLHWLIKLAIDHKDVWRETAERVLIGNELDS